MRLLSWQSKNQGMAKIYKFMKTSRWIIVGDRMKKNDALPTIMCPVLSVQTPCSQESNRCVTKMLNFTLNLESLEMDWKIMRKGTMSSFKLKLLRNIHFNRGEVNKQREMTLSIGSSTLLAKPKQIPSRDQEHKFIYHTIFISSFCISYCALLYFELYW